MRPASSDADSGVKVEVLVLGGEVKTVFLGEESTVEDALEAAGVSTSSTVKCRGEVVELNDFVDNGDKLVVTNKVKGGQQ